MGYDNRMDEKAVVTSRCVYFDENGLNFVYRKNDRLDCMRVLYDM